MTHTIQIGDEVRPMTDEEIASWQQAMNEIEASRAEREAQHAAQEAAKASARVKLAALGLTDEEVAALIP